MSGLVGAGNIHLDRDADPSATTPGSSFGYDFEEHPAGSPFPWDIDTTYINSVSLMGLLDDSMDVYASVDIEFIETLFAHRRRKTMSRRPAQLEVGQERWVGIYPRR